MFVLLSWIYWYQVVQGFIKHSLRNLDSKYYTEFYVDFPSWDLLASSATPESVYKHVTKKGYFNKKKYHRYFRLQNVNYFNNCSFLWHQVTSQCSFQWGQWRPCLDCFIVNELRERRHFFVLWVNFYINYISGSIWNR